MELSLEQRRVAARMIVAILMTLTVMGAALWLAASGTAQPLPDRLTLALRFQLLPALLVAGLIGNIARLRFFSTDDIAGSSSGTASQSLRDASSILQNTFEQAFIFVLAEMNTAAVWEHPAPLLIAHAALFAVGRTLFIRGYAHGAASRALGFALTFYPTVALLLITAIELLTRSV